MSAREGAHCVTCAVGLLLVSAPALARAQQAAAPEVVPAQIPATAPIPLDPNAPLAPLPDIGVDWPDLATAPGAGTQATSQSAVAETKYTYKLDGIDAITDQLFRQRFDEISTLRAHNKEAANGAQIDRRARQDADLLTGLLRGEGYYDAAVTPAVATVQGKPQVTLAAQLGQRYTFTEVTVTGLAPTGAKAKGLRDAFAVERGDPVDADTVAAGEAKLAVEIGREGFPFAKVGKSQIVVDHATHTAQLDIAVTSGAALKYGRIIATTGKVFDAKHIQEIARFEPGQPYDTTGLDDLRHALVQTSLVSSAIVKPVPGSTPGTVDIDVALEPAPKHTISGELGYNTGEGARAEVDWTNRNMFPPEGALTLRGILGTKEQGAGVIFRRSNFHARDRVLTLQLNASHTVYDAYEAKTLSLGASIERQSNIFFQKAWTWSVGTELLATDEQDADPATGIPRTRTYLIAALPGQLGYDGSDDLLNPTRGFRLSGRLSPELSLQGAAFGYARTQLDASTYQPISKTVVLAERIRLGTIIGAPRDKIAPSRRFYAGGGASVRGYGYQDIGPRDVDNNPIGGRSLTEFSIEARVRAFGNFGIVPFFDGGNIYTTPLPKFTGLRYGAGLGVRYYSSFGPIRVDVGTPINPQKGDPRVAVYVSLGQAF